MDTVHVKIAELALSIYSSNREAKRLSELGFSEAAQKEYKYCDSQIAAAKQLVESLIKNDTKISANNAFSKAPRQTTANA